MQFPSDARPNVATTAALVIGKALAVASGTHLSTTVQIDSTAPTALYYIQFVQGNAANTIPADGAYAGPPSLLHMPFQVSHVSGTPDLLTINDGPGGLTFANGLWVILSTTPFTKTGAAYLLVDGVVA